METHHSLKPLTNECILLPIDEQAQFSAGGLLLVNKYKRPTLKFKVLAVGPPGYVQRTKANGKKKMVFRSPEVEVGDMVLCRAILESGIAKAHLEDGTGRIVVSSENILAKWSE
jgi:co-chaperonin GroES (HSP10)